MLTSAKKGFFIDSSEHLVLLARTTSTVAPLVIEELIECAPSELGESVKVIKSAKSKVGYLQAKCGVGIPQRVVRRLTNDPKRLKEPAYLGEVTAQQLRIDPAAYTLAALNPLTGRDYDMVKAAQKDMLVCGLPTAEIGLYQDALLAAGVYPLAVELGTVASIGAMVDYLHFANIKSPVLMLEIEAQATNSYIVSVAGLEASRTIPHGLESMIPFVQKELGLKDEAAARKLFLSNAFDFTGMGSVLVKKIIKELQSSIGFYEVQTGQSISQVACTVLPSKLTWLEGVLANDLGVSVLKPDVSAWLQSHAITLGGNLTFSSHGTRCLGLLGLMIQSNNTNLATSEKPQ